MTEPSVVATVFEVAFLVLFVSVWTNASTNVHFDRTPSGLDCDDNHKIEVMHDNEVINSTLTPDGHFKEITVTVRAFRRIFILDLKLNRHLFAVGFIQKSITRNGEVFHAANHTEDHCYYLGTVRDRPDSSAAVSTCSGIVGYFVIRNVSYHIDPLGKRICGPHKVYRSRRDAKTIFRCDLDEVSLNTMLNPALQKKRLKRSFMWPQDHDKKTKVVELYVANDRSQYLSKGSNESVVFQRTKDIVNIASITYQSIDIYLVLVGVEVWIDDPITVDTSSASNTLESWSSYRMTNINPKHYNDNGVLLTNNTFAVDGGTVVALANPGTMCSNRYSASFVADIYPLATVTSTVMNHEIGHTFNLVHDDQVTAGCPCTDPNGQCIMYSVTNAVSPSKTWSECSKDQLSTSFQQGLDICLYNSPQTIYDATASCGNGIVEEGEQCDCGNSTSDECNTDCCDATTCQLTANAACAYGGCCNITRCETLPCGTPCRSKANDCDLREYCNGQDGLCPSDTHKPDGTNCTVKGVAAYCYSGLCRSRESQCQLLWGPTSHDSHDICYSTYNTQGVSYGNCGMNWLPTITYIPCPPSHVFCGQLQCQSNEQNQLYYYQYNNITMNTTRPYLDITCLTVVFDMGLATLDPGLVPNGASCGTGQMLQMCVNQTCVDVSDVLSPTCATECLQNEVCNNLGQCQRTIGECEQSTIILSENSAQTTITQLSTITTSIAFETPTIELTSTVQTTLPTEPTTTSTVQTTLTTEPTTISTVQTTSITEPTTTVQTTSTTKPTMTSTTVQTTSTTEPTATSTVQTTSTTEPTSTSTVQTTSTTEPTTTITVQTTSTTKPTTTSIVQTTSTTEPTRTSTMQTTSTTEPTTTSTVTVQSISTTQPTTTSTVQSTSTTEPTTTVQTTSTTEPTTTSTVPTTSTTVRRSTLPTPSSNILEAVLSSVLGALLGTLAGSSVLLSCYYFCPAFLTFCCPCCFSCSRRKSTGCDTDLSVTIVKVAPLPARPCLRWIPNGYRCYLPSSKVIERPCVSYYYSPRCRASPIAVSQSCRQICRNRVAENRICATGIFYPRRMQDV